MSLTTPGAAAMSHNLVRLVAAIALLTSPLTALAWDDCKFAAERRGGIDTTVVSRYRPTTGSRSMAR